jgi:hypothetical protein
MIRAGIKFGCDWIECLSFSSPPGDHKCSCCTLSFGLIFPLFSSNVVDVLHRFLCFWVGVIILHLVVVENTRMVGVISVNA